MKETGVRNGAIGADKFGFDGIEAVHWNLAEPPLYEFAIRAGEAELAYGGALCADTGAHTGRSPKDKFIVRDALTDKTVWWDNNGTLTPEQFQRLYQDFIAPYWLVRRTTSPKRIVASPIVISPFSAVSA